MKKSPRSIEHAVALITGAATGMGRATAELFASEGAYVAIADINAAEGVALAAKIRENGGKAEAWRLDVGDSAQIAAVVPEIAAAFGGLDIVVNNAGIAAFMAVDDEGFDALWDRMLRVNLSSHQRIIRAALPFLRRSDAPRIVNIASTEALGATIRDSAYAAAKAGVTGLTRALAVELGREGITVNCICPGAIDTPMNDFASPDDKKIFANRRTCLRRYGMPEEVAQMTLSLCLPAASYVTGVTIPVDGGLMARNA